MNQPFNFPIEYGKIGNWPGTINHLQAQFLYSYGVQCKPGARFVEVGFDGGRTTIALGWAAYEIGATIEPIDVAPGAMRFWLNRAVSLFRIKLASSPAPSDLIVINAGAPISDSLLKSLHPGAVVIKLGSAGESPSREFIELHRTQGQVVVWQKTNEAQIVNAAIDKVVGDVSAVAEAVENIRPSGHVMDAGGSPKVRSLRGDKERNRDRGGADTPLDAQVVGSKSH